MPPGDEVPPDTVCSAENPRPTHGGGGEKEGEGCPNCCGTDGLTHPVVGARRG